MRTEPVDIYLMYPSVGTQCLQVFVPENVDISTHPCFNMSGVEFHAVGSVKGFLIELEEQKNSKDVFIHLDGWMHEEEAMHSLYEYLERNNGFTNLFISPTNISNRYFSHVAVDIEFCRPEYASKKVPEDGFNGLMDILDEMYENEAAATEEAEYSINSNGDILCCGKVVDSIFNAKRISYEDLDDAFYVRVIRDSKHTDVFPLQDENITPSGYYNENSANIFYELSNLSKGVIGIVSKRMQPYEPRKFFVMRPWQRLSIYSEAGSPHLRYSTTEVPAGCEIKDLYTPFTINNAIGVIFARVAAYDQRWKLDFEAELIYNGHVFPITYKHAMGGDVQLSIDEFCLTHNNYFKYVTRR